MSLKTELYDLMVKYRFSPSKKKGQVFMVDEELLSSLVQAADLKKKDKVLEIGPGTGFLTKQLLLKRVKVIGVELDDRLSELLESEIKSKNFHLINGNILEVNLPKFNKIVANPPYTISHDLMYLLYKHKFETAVLTFQMEFANKLMASPGFKEYNALSVLTQYHYKIDHLHPRISPNAFYPTTGLFSSTIRLLPHTENGKACNDPAFTAFVKCIFRFKNKNCHNSIQKSLQFIEKECKINPKKLEKVTKESPIMDEKTNTLGASELVALFNEISDAR